MILEVKKNSFMIKFMSLVGDLVTKNPKKSKIKLSVKTLSIVPKNEIFFPKISRDYAQKENTQKTNTNR